MPVSDPQASSQESSVERISGFLESERISGNNLLSLPGIILSTGEGSIRHYQFHPEAQDVPVTSLVCQSQDPLPLNAKTELLVRQGHIVAMLFTDARITLRPEILRRAAIREVLQREWLLSVFLFGPVLGVVLVNMIFGMPVFLWWTALGVLIFSCLIMGILIRNDLRKLQRWVQELHTHAP